MVLAGHVLADGGLHETGQGRQHVDWRVDLPVVELTVDVDLWGKGSVSYSSNDIARILFIMNTNHGLK